jgi:hypothetical protein
MNSNHLQYLDTAGNLDANDRIGNYVNFENAVGMA